MNSAAVRSSSRQTTYPRRSIRRRHVTFSGIARVTGALLVFASGIVIVLALVIQPEPPEPVAWTAVSVEHTGTLWQIAAENRVRGLSTAETADLIREENGLSSSTLHEGQLLVVPDEAGRSLSVAQR